MRPDGKKRSPMAFMPFYAGKRNCLGKTYAEMMVRLVVGSLIMKYDFEFVNETDSQKEFTYNLSIKS